MGVPAYFYIFVKPNINWLAIVVFTLTQISTATDMETGSRSIINHQAGTTVSITHTRCVITVPIPILAMITMM